MSTNIGAETARWAGLQIDLHSKFRSGNLSADQLEWWLNQPKDKRDSFMVGDESTRKPPLFSSEKFALLADLGIITVPEDYEHSTRLASFKEKNRSRFYFYNDGITDKHFRNPSRVLKPGDRLRVEVYRQNVPGTTTSKERLTFLRSRNAVFTSAQGVSLVFEQKRDELPKGYWYSSFDEPEYLWKDAGGYHRVPRMGAGSDGGFGFGLGYFGEVWSGYYALLCFRDAE